MIKEPDCLSDKLVYRLNFFRSFQNYFQLNNNLTYNMKNGTYISGNTAINY